MLVERCIWVFGRKLPEIKALRGKPAGHPSYIIQV
jgi:hypothetical protein